MIKSDVWKYHGYKEAFFIYKRERRFGRLTVSKPWCDGHMWCLTVLY